MTTKIGTTMKMKGNSTIAQPEDAIEGGRIVIEQGTFSLTG